MFRKITLISAMILTMATVLPAKTILVGADEQQKWLSGECYSDRLLICKARQ